MLRLIRTKTWNNLQIELGILRARAAEVDTKDDLIAMLRRAVQSAEEERAEIRRQMTVTQQELTNVVNGQLSSDRFLMTIQAFNEGIPKLRANLRALGVELPQYKGEDQRRINQSQAQLRLADTVADGKK